MTAVSPHARYFALAIAVLGCGSETVPEIEHDDSSTSTSSDDTMTPEASTSSGVAATSESTDASTSTGSAASSSSSSGGDVDVPRGFIEQPDSAYGVECTTWDQNCPSGEKCTWWADDGGNSWNATRCSPIDADPDGIGESCTVVDSGVSGLDSCDLGLICWDVDFSTDTGACVSFCSGSESSPVCKYPGTTCSIYGDGLPVCLPPCDPLEQDCVADEVCLPAGEGFACAPDASGDLGVFGDPCEYANVCDPGLFCADPATVPGCASADGCCSAYCDLDAPSCPAAEQDCVAAYEPADAPWGFEDVGFCEVV